MQKVSIYYDVLEAKREMERWIRDEWRVHTCTMGMSVAGYSPFERIIVVYEKG